MNKSVRLEGFTTSKDGKTSIIASVMSAAISMCQKVESDNSKILGSLLRFSAQNPRLYRILHVIPPTGSTALHVVWIIYLYDWDT